MKAVKKFVILIITAFMLCLAVMCLSGGRGESARASVDDNYRFNEIAVSVNVNKNKTYDVTERLTVHFSQGGVNTGIIRDIQRISRVTRVIDGKQYKGSEFFATLDNVSVTFDGGEAKVTQGLYDSNQFFSVMMQNPNGYMEADSTHVFELKYTYGCADDRLKGFDDFTFDVLGYGMAYVEKFTAEINFPQGTDLSATSVRTGILNEWTPYKTGGEKFKVSGNTVSMTAYPKSAKRGYTVQVILGKGYYSVGLNMRWYYFVFFLFAVGASATALGLAFYRKRSVEAVTFYPPDDMSVMRFSSIFNAGARNKDVASIILKWAGAGIVTITPDGDKHFVLKANIETKPRKKKKKKGDVLGLDEETVSLGASGDTAGVSLSKGDAKHRAGLSSYNLKDGGEYCFDAYERQLFDTLFSGIGGGKNTFSTRKYRSARRYEKERLYKAVQTLVKHGNEKPVPAVESKKEEVIKCVLPYIGLLPMFFYMVYMCLLSSVALMLFFVPFWCAGTFVSIMYRKERVILMLLFPIMFVGVTYGAMLAIAPYYCYDYFYLRIIAPIIYVICAFILPYFVRKRTADVLEEYGRLLGFKRFLLTAELHKIQLLFDEHPDYFTEILPYCLIMGISKKVRERFKGLQNIVTPVYVSDDIDINRFSRGIGRSASYGAPRPSISGGGSGGGGGGGSGGHGGSSGGGSGGGGSRGC